MVGALLVLQANPAWALTAAALMLGAEGHTPDHSGIARAGVPSPER